MLSQYGGWCYYVPSPKRDLLLSDLVGKGKKCDQHESPTFRIRLFAGVEEVFSLFADMWHLISEGGDVARS